MINMKDFAGNMKQLEAAFGYKMPEERLEIYYQKLSRKFDSIEFEKATDHLIFHCKRFPTISDFMEIASSKRPLL